jgi:hypothetical protein
LTATYSSSEPDAPSASENASAWVSVNSPRAVGRHAVRAILRSIWRSTRQLNAAAALATSQIPIVAGNAMRHSGIPGAANSMPITAQNTISCTTRGLVSAMYCIQRGA